MRRGKFAFCATIFLEAGHLYHSMEIKRPILAQAELATTDDMKLVAAVLGKDRKATAEFVARYTDGVYKYIRGRVPQIEVVEDLGQEQLFGKEGFERMVPRVADIEKQLGIYDEKRLGIYDEKLGIYDLSLFTPR